MTESIMAASITLSKHQEMGGVRLSLMAGEDLVAGQEVYLSANQTVSKRTGAQFPIGIVEVGGLNGTLVTVMTCFMKTLKAHIKVADVAFGVFVKPNGTFNASLKPEYVIALSPVLSNGTTTSVLGDWINGIAIKGAVVDAEAEIGIFRNPIIGKGTIST